jgi:glycosyltransferase involved in cell wall biosynthesis
MKLVMTILVKNEADIIEDNIRFHAAQGVDAFLVMDNDSSDGTSDILQKLGADLIISNDADEFWAATDGKGLKSRLHNQESVITVKRFNYAMSNEQFKRRMPYWQCLNKVVSPILYSSSDQLKRQGLSMPLVKISPKTIVNPRGLLKIKGGNHRARHLMFWRDRDESGIEVHHFPIRSYEQFEKNIQNRKALLEKNPQTRMGDHYRRWVEQYNRGALPAEFEKIALLDSDIDVLQKVGVIEQSASHLLAFKQAEQPIKR